MPQNQGFLARDFFIFTHQIYRAKYSQMMQNILCQTWKIDLVQTFLAAMGEGLLSQADEVPPALLPYTSSKLHCLPIYWVASLQGAAWTPDDANIMEQNLASWASLAPSATLHFQSDGTFTLRLARASYAGKWTLTGNLLTGSIQTHLGNYPYHAPADYWVLNEAQTHLVGSPIDGLTLSVPLFIQKTLPIDFQAILVSGTERALTGVLSYTQQQQTTSIRVDMYAADSQPQ